MSFSLEKLDAMGRFMAFLFFGRSTPLAAYWKITYRCNSRCSYCGVWQKKNKKEEKELDTETLLSLMTQARRAGLYRTNLSGGEPLLREDFGLLVRHLKDLGVSVGVDTNGSLVEDRIEDLGSVDGVAMSLDGDESVHDLHRGKGSHGKVLRAADLLKRVEAPFQFNCAITNKNFDRLDTVLQMARWYETRVLFQPVTPFKHDSDDPNPLAPTHGQVFAAASFLLGSSRDRGLIANPRVYLRRLMGMSNLPPLPCPGGRLACLINPDGMMGCCDYGVPSDPFRDAVKMGFKAAFDSLTRPPDCSRCICATVVTLQLAMKLDPSAILALLSTC